MVTTNKFKMQIRSLQRHSGLVSVRRPLLLVAICARHIGGVALAKV
jgi:hypothetical protein